MFRLRHFLLRMCLPVLALAAFTACSSESDLGIDRYNLLPIPQSAEFSNDFVEITSVALDMPFWEEQWRETLTQAGVIVTEDSPVKVEGFIVDSIPGCADSNQEAYSLNISRRGIKAEAVSEKGLYWALMTLRQIMESAGDRLPVCTINDWPAFPFRGFMMDVGRTYISLDELKREIEIMSQFKMNVFHLHLTENQAWRLESRIYPQITDSASMTRQPGKYYTVDECRELEKWAADHNVTLIPEIDMPGHSDAFRRATGHDMQSPEGMALLKRLVSEACSTFIDSPYLHIGTDEVEFTNPDFVGEMVGFVRSCGKKVISWNPGWNYKPGEVDMIQLWSYRGKAQPGIPAVDSRFHYINHFDTYADIVALYRSRIYDREAADEDIAGVCLALWNDRNIADESEIIAQNNLFPLLLATAERAWRGGGIEYFDSLGTNMAPPGSKDFNDFADFERRFLHYKTTSLKDYNVPYVRQTNVAWRITDAFPNDGDLGMVFPPETMGPRDSYTFNDSVYQTHDAYGAGIYLRHVWGKTVPSFYDNPQPNHTAYAYTQVYSPEAQTVGLQFETQNFSRSERDLTPPQGKWDFRESRLWINGNEIESPAWIGSDGEIGTETPMGNENMAVRPPIPVRLNKGWNQVLIKLPVGEFSTPETRLVKWMFTFVFTTPDGREAMPGLIYSPSSQ